MEKNIKMEFDEEFIRKAGGAIVEDLEKWIGKLNAMMLASGEGNCPQILKIIVMKKIVDLTAGQHKKEDKKKYKLGEKLIDEYLSKFAKLRMVKEDKLKKLG